MELFQSQLVSSRVKNSYLYFCQVELDLRFRGIQGIKDMINKVIASGEYVPFLLNRIQLR
jgi:hypothetical protein